MYSFFVVVFKKVCKLNIILALSNKKTTRIWNSSKAKNQKDGLLELQQG